MTDLPSPLAPPVDEPSPFVLAMTRVYAGILLAGFALLPSLFIAYLYFFQDPRILIRNDAFHELAIAVATAESVFIGYVTWQCYWCSGERMLRWLTLGFAGFVIVYAPHGVFTPLAVNDIWLFLLYGPASRLVMAVLLLAGGLSYGRSPDSQEARIDRWYWWSWLVAFVVIDLLVAVLANTPVAGTLATRLALECGALAVSLTNVACLLVRGIQAPLMKLFAISVCAFAFSSLAFLLSRPWNHMWWLAHAIFAWGFLLLSYGIVKAFHTTRSFSRVYGEDELVARLHASMARTEAVLQELQRSKQKLEQLKTARALAGTVDRRAFVEAIEREIVRSGQGGLSFSLLALEVDNLERITDRFGPDAGEDVLCSVVDICIDALSTYGGAVCVEGAACIALIPHAATGVALTLGERIRSNVQASLFESDHHRFSATVSIGIAQYAQDGTESGVLMRVAEARLARAKRHGRNCVIAI